MRLINSFRAYIQWWRTWKALPIRAWIDAARLYRGGRYSEAQVLYQRGIKRFPNHPAICSARVDLAYCLFKQREVGESEKELRSVISQFPHYREGFMRLARLQLWVGRSADAAFTLRRAIQQFPVDPEISALLLLCLIDQKSSPYLVGEAVSGVKRARELFPGNKLLKIAEARCVYFLGDRQQGKVLIAELAFEDPALFDGVLAYAEILNEEEEREESLRHLRRALQVSPNHPRILSLMAKIYLADSALFNPEFAMQIALSACQNTRWSSVRDLKVLAEAYYHLGDNSSAVAVLKKAEALGLNFEHEKPHDQALNRLIEELALDTASQS